jgi:hypothetical protein
MERIEGQLADEEELAKQVLSWITCAKRPLTTSELEHAIATEAGEPQLDPENFCRLEDMVSACAGLVTIDEESKIIRLVHFTTQEYFERTKIQWFPDAQAKIAITCVTYLSLDVFKSGICQKDEELEERLQSNQLYHYAAKNWGHHPREASILIPEAISFLEKRTQVEASCQALLAIKEWSSRVGYSQEFARQMRGLDLAAYFGVKLAVPQLLKKGADIAAANNYGQTSLHWASKTGHVDVVKLLLEKGADIVAADKYRRTPLHEASITGHVDVVNLLLEKGADLEVAGESRRTPLFGDSKTGHVDVVKLLLEKGADIEAADKDGKTL